MSSTPLQMPEPESRNGAAIGKAVRVVGRIHTKEDLYIEGDVEGAIESQDSSVTIGPKGRIQADIRARDVIILGQVQGKIEASNKVDVRKDSMLVGDITALRISLEEGCLVEAKIDVGGPEPRSFSAAARA